MAHSKFARIFTAVFWGSVFRNLIDTSKRFPLAVVSLLLLTLLIFTEIHDFDLFNNKLLEKLILFFVGGFLWFSSATLLCENRHWEGIKKYLFLIIIYLIYCWRVYLDPKFTLELSLLFSALLLSLSFFPRLFRQSDNASSWYFNFQIITAIVVALLASVIFSGGLSLILVSIEFLFEVNVEDELYGDAWLLGMGLFAPLYVLAQLPKKFDFGREDCEFPKGVHFILNFVMIPLALVYMVILYAYFIKILLQWNLPHGHLGWMISVFGILGILTHLAIYPIQDKNKPLMGWFYRNFYWIMIVPLILLITAIGVRIQQYGVTENRYIVVICAVWFAWLIANNLFYRKKFKLTTVTISLAILLFFSAFGPWGIKQFSVSSQFSQFQKILQQFEMLKEGKIQPPQKSLDKETERSLSSIADYIAKQNSINKFRVLFNDPKVFDEALNCTPEKPCRSRDVTKLLSLMEIKYVSRWHYIDNYETIISINTEANRNNFSMLPTKGYDYIVPLNWLYPSLSKFINPWGKDNILPQLQLQLTDKGILTVSSENMTSVSFDLIKFSEQFPQNESTVITPEEQDKMVLTISNDKISISLRLTRISFNQQDGKTILQNLTGNLFIKIKNADELLTHNTALTHQDTHNKK